MLSARASADKFQSSFSNDYIQQTKQKDSKITPVSVQKIPETATSPVQQQTAVSNTDWTPAPVQTQAITPPLYIPPLPDISAPVPSLSSPKVPTLTKTRITVPNFEEKYKKLLAAQAEAKRKKKKSLIDSILDEIVHYGFLIVLGLVILVVVYVLRKDKETPGTGFQMPQHPEKPQEQREPKKDIWQDDF
ncbi:MAG: hypothetical protein AAB213_01930 [Candidatus Omnitrophota bacterium]